MDRGDEGTIDTPAGPLGVYSFHMTLSYSRDPFCCFVARQDLATFYGCHRRAFAHFGGAPAEILCDRTKTVVTHHVGRGQGTPLHPEAVAFAGHYGYAVRLCAPRLSQTKAVAAPEFAASEFFDTRDLVGLGVVGDAGLHRHAVVAGRRRPSPGGARPGPPPGRWSRSARCR